MLSIEKLPNFVKDNVHYVPWDNHYNSYLTMQPPSSGKIITPDIENQRYIICESDYTYFSSDATYEFPEQIEIPAVYVNLSCSDTFLANQTYEEFIYEELHQYMYTFIKDMRTLGASVITMYYALQKVNDFDNFGITFRFKVYPVGIGSIS